MNGFSSSLGLDSNSFLSPHSFLPKCYFNSKALQSNADFPGEKIPSETLEHLNLSPPVSFWLFCFSHFSQKNTEKSLYEDYCLPSSGALGLPLELGHSTQQTKVLLLSRPWGYHACEGCL